MQLFFWFSIALLAFASFAYISIPLFFTADKTTTSVNGFKNPIALIFAVILAAGSVLLYAQIGNPTFVERVAESELDKKYADIIGQIEAHLAQNPEDAEGWQVVAPTYLSLNKPEKAFEAFANAIKFGNSNGKNWLGLGKANLIINDGVFGPMTKVAFTKAQEKSPEDVEAMYFYASMLFDGEGGQVAKQAIEDFISKHNYDEEQLLPLAEILKIIGQE